MASLINVLQVGNLKDINSSEFLITCLPEHFCPFLCYHDRNRRPVGVR